MARGFSFELRRREGWLELHAAHHPRYGAIRADWHSADVRRRVAAGRRQLLARAVGLHLQPHAAILDATAGLGRDAYVLAALGAQVTLVERQPLIHALLEDALRRDASSPAGSRMQLHCGDARDWLEPQRWDVVYLDPMYPRSGKALAGKELQILRELNREMPDEADLLTPARRSARRRVVVKRPLKAPPLAGSTPAFTLRGTQARFDVYVPVR